MKKTWIPEFWWLEDRLVSADGVSDPRMGHTIVVRQFMGKHVMEELGLPSLDWDDAPAVRCGIGDMSIALYLRHWLSKEEWPTSRIDDDPWDAIDAAAYAAKLPGCRNRQSSTSLYKVWSDNVEATDFAVEHLGWVRIAGLNIDVDTFEGTGKRRLQAAVEALMRRYPSFYRPEVHVFVARYGGDQRSPQAQRSLRLEELSRGEFIDGINPPEFRPAAVRKLDADITHSYYRKDDRRIR